MSIYNRIIVLLLNDQPHFFQNLFMGPGAHCHINPGCLNGGMAQKVRQMRQILLLFIKALGEQVPQIVREYLARWRRDLRGCPRLMFCPEGPGLLVKKILFRCKK